MAAPVHSIQVALNWPETAIEKDNLLDWVQFYYSKNSFYGQSKYEKIARDFEPLFGEPRFARRATKSMGGALRRPKNDFWKIGTSGFDVFIQFRSNSFYQKFLKNPMPAAAGGGQGESHGSRAKNFLP